MYKIYKNFLNEISIISKPHKVYNFENFLNGKTPLIILGYSGSGKTTISNKLSKKYKVQLIEEDELIRKNRKHLDKLDQYEKFDKMIDITFDILNTKKILIYKGVNLLYGFSYNMYLKDYYINNFPAILLMGTSYLKSSFNTLKRNKNLFDFYNKLFHFNKSIDTYYNYCEYLFDEYNTSISYMDNDGNIIN